ncbi:MAG: HAMP domain-containing histidine kinase, partial [Pseudomonadota bacterium]|nr:HAMP domain-containing histidine kinase [Pseudomonadota bacterium]
LKDEFLSTVTHELLTPLTAVRAFSELLYDNPDTELEQRQEFLSLIIKESERLTRLINQVLDMAKIEAGEMEFHIGPVDLRTVMEEALETTGQLFRDKGIVVERCLADGLPPVRGDRDRLMQVAVNLLSNAAKFTPPESGRVEARLGLQDGAVRADIRDNGPGIAPEYLDVIFEKFRQAGNTLTDKPAGTGLGLAICRRIVEHLGGRIWVESRLGEGATFSFTVPAMPPTGEAGERTAADAVAGR